MLFSWIKIFLAAFHLTHQLFLTPPPEKKLYIIRWHVILWVIYLQINWKGICKQSESSSVRKLLKSFKKDNFIGNATSSLLVAFKMTKPVINQIYPGKY